MHDRIHSLMSRTQRRATSQVRAGLLALGRRRRPVPSREAEQLRSEGYPHPYPTGWYVLARSDELGTTPLRVNALGRAFVLFRDSKREAHVLDAKCPHQGADLSLGRVRGECIECPFHHWQFDGAGSVHSVPYASHVPRSLRTASWPTLERYGFVFAFVSHDPAVRNEPAFSLQTFSSVDDGELVHRGDFDAGTVRMHIVEFAENSADVQHFAPLHGAMFVPWTGLRVPWLRVRHQATWELDDSARHIAWFHNDAVLVLADRDLKATAARATIQIAGPGGLVSFHFDVPRFGRILLLQSHTPEAPLSQRVRFRWFAERAMPRGLVEYVVGSWVTQWREDVSIWEGKGYCQKPMLLPGDGPIHDMRRWYAAFLPERDRAAGVQLTRSRPET
jgi:cholesterol 7-dehydrogenase